MILFEEISNATTGLSKKGTVFGGAEEEKEEAEGDIF